MIHPASLHRLLARRRVLLLQGPMGHFFARLAEALRQHGQSVHKVNFNGGDDRYFDGEGVFRFRGRPAEWPMCLRSLIEVHGVDAIVLFGQSRPLHQVAIAEARARGLAIFVFEEGYVRPDYVTLELGGVNGWSTIPRDRAFYDRLTIDSLPSPEPTNQAFGQIAATAMSYASAAALGRWRYPHYVHHRSLHPLAEGSRWLIGGARKWVRRLKERHRLAELVAPERSHRWFLVPLQVHNDAQIRDHSPFADNVEFIDTVLRSFAGHAHVVDWLVFKHHPLDRPYNDYSDHIARRALELGISDRVRYVHDPHLPTLLKHTRGIVTINSTTGIQALYHGTPVLPLGDCLYAVPGLTHGGPLETFWHAPGDVDAELFRRFRSYLVQQCQLNASFYGDAPGLPNYSSGASARRLSSSPID